MKTRFIYVVVLAVLSYPKNSMAQDWPNLAKYQEANDILDAPKTNEHRVVFLGNSITEGWSQANPDYFEKNPYINRGIGGQTTPQMVLRFQQDVVALKPSMVLILAGTNDIAGNTGPMTLEQIRDNILSMVQLAKANDIVPVVCSVLPAYDYPWRPGLEPNIKIPKLNSLLEQMAKAQDAPYLDYFTAMADDRNGLPKKWSYDEVHLTKEGYQVLEGLAEAKIKEILSVE